MAADIYTAEAEWAQLMYASFTGCPVALELRKRYNASSLGSVRPEHEHHWHLRLADDGAWCCECVAKHPDAGSVAIPPALLEKYPDA